MLASRVNDSKDLRERAAEMRASSKELKDNNTATVILRLAELYGRLAERAESRSNGGVPQVLRLSADAIGGTWPPSPVRCAACF
jgi:hypothetical protein